MANVVGRSSLWTPEGEVTIGQKDVKMVSAAEGRVFREMHALAQRYRIGLVCMLCDKAIQGSNGGGESTQSVTCQCREFRFPSRSA